MTISVLIFSIILMILLITLPKIKIEISNLEIIKSSLKLMLIKLIKLKKLGITENELQESLIHYLNVLNREILKNHDLILNCENLTWNDSNSVNLICKICSLKRQENCLEFSINVTYYCRMGNGYTIIYTPYLGIYFDQNDSLIKVRRIRYEKNYVVIETSGQLGFIKDKILNMTLNCS